MWVYLWGDGTVCSNVCYCFLSLSCRVIRQGGLILVHLLTSGWCLHDLIRFAGWPMGWSVENEVTNDTIKAILIWRSYQNRSEYLTSDIAVLSDSVFPLLQMINRTVYGVNVTVPVRTCCGADGSQIGQPNGNVWCTVVDQRANRLVSGCTASRSIRRCSAIFNLTAWLGLSLPNNALGFLSY